jgi:type VI secretion system secreted protein VgrG
MSGSNQPMLLLSSPLGDDTLPIQQGTLHAIALVESERLSKPYEMRLTVVSTMRAIDPDELLYQPVCVTLRRKPLSDRYFHGIVRRMEAVGLPRRDRWIYHLDVVPRLWFLNQTGDCRIFQQKTAIEILQTLFSEHEVAPVEFRIFGEKPKREYTTQYNETDLRFLDRLLQESGYFYFFEHTPAAHKLVITDRNQAFAPVDHPEQWVIHEGNNADIFDEWQEALQTAYGSVRLQDYDPTRPSTPILGSDTTSLATAGSATRVVFGWPAMTFESRIATDRARFYIEASEAAASIRQGHGYNSEFAPGRRFTLARDPFTKAEGISHAVHGVEHHASDDTWIAGSAQPTYENRFTCLPQTVSWREALSIPRPSMAGIYSAIVLGNPGEEIHADPLGRIKARLLFDHRKETTASMGTWLRVMQPWSGDGWGWQHLPRVGTEVGVSFMNGDPDSPVVVGCFYHQESQPPFPIPELQTKQGWRTRSTPRGGSNEYSEISIDDRAGQELMYLQAQKDQTTKVKNDQRLTVDSSRTVRIGASETKTIADSYSLTTETGPMTVNAAASTIDISAALSITLRVADNVILINDEGIFITGNIINLTAEGMISNEAPEITMEATEINLTGAAITMEAAEIDLTGASVTIDGGTLEVEVGLFLSEPMPMPEEV